VGLRDWSVRFPAAGLEALEETLRAIPGVARRRDVYVATVDGFNVAAALFGWPPVQDTGPPGAPRPEAALRPYQRDAVAWLTSPGGGAGILALPMQCLAGDTVVWVAGRGGRTRTTLRDVFGRFRSDRLSCCIESWDPDDGTIRWDLVVRVHGPKHITDPLTIRAGGRTIVTSRDHRFMTPASWRKADDLEVGDAVFMDLSRPEENPVPRAAVPVAIEAITDAPAQAMYDLTVLGEPHNYIADGFVVSNSGKTRVVLESLATWDVPRALIVGPATAGLQWAQQAREYLGWETFLLEGRAGDRGRVPCLRCGTRRRVEGGAPCPACRGANGAPLGYRLVRDAAGVYRELDGCKLTYVSYDALYGHRGRGRTGVGYAREDLPGALPTLLTEGREFWGAIIADEAHRLRGRSKRSGGKTSHVQRVEAFRTLVGHDALLPAGRDSDEYGPLARRVVLVTGTPQYGRVRDNWSLLDLLTGGKWGDGPRAFDIRYCAAVQGEWGWDNRGASALARIELPGRLGRYIWRRNRADILPDMPPKTRKVEWVEPSRAAIEAAEFDALFDIGDGPDLAEQVEQGAFEKQSKETLSDKLPILEEVIEQGCQEGLRIMVFCYHKQAVRKLSKTLLRLATRTASRGGWATKDEPRVWTVDGSIQPRARVAMAQAFQDVPEGFGAVLVATIDSLQEAVTIRGIDAVHFAELHHNPKAIEQAEDRGYQPDSKGLVVTYWAARGTLDEALVGKLVDKSEQARDVHHDREAASLARTLRGQS
jgi:hypothetical protein